jgi:CBS domain containing-hemolysin-like protein
MFEWTLIRGIMVAFFILANSFFVAAEFALVSIRETRVEQLIAQGKPGSRTVLQLKHNMDDFLPAVQLGVTLASLALGWIGEPSVARVIEYVGLRALPVLQPHIEIYANAAAIVLAFGFITYFEVLLGELVPKALALQRAERIALAVAGPMDVFIRMSRPAVHLMNTSATVVLRIFKAPLRGEGAVHSPDELKLIASATRRMGLLPAFQEEMIHRAIELSHVVVREIMTPRGKIFSLPSSLSLEQASARVVEEQHSRVPIYDPVRGPEHIVGIVYSKDISRLMHFRGSAAALGSRVSSGITLREVMRDVLFVPETKLAVDLLQEFQERRRQIAIVVDEFGTTVGLVTAEDALEQIVGELQDEFDTTPGAAVLSSPGIVTMDGTTTLRDLNTRLGWTFPREAGVETLAGFVLSQLGHIPKLGERIVHEGRSFIVEEMTGHRISRVRIQDLQSAHATHSSETEDDGLEVTA